MSRDYDEAHDPKHFNVVRGQRVEKAKEYFHVTKGLCRLIGPDPEDGALLIMERVGDDDVLGQYFGTEASDLYTVGERLR